MNQAGVEWSGEKWNGEDGEEWRKKPVQKIVALSLQSICQLISSGQDTSSFLFPNLFFRYVLFFSTQSHSFCLFMSLAGDQPLGPQPSEVSFNQRGAQQQKF